MHGIVAGAESARHHFIAVDELIEWSKYLATQRPECRGEAL